MEPKHNIHLSSKITYMLGFRFKVTGIKQLNYKKI